MEHVIKVDSIHITDPVTKREIIMHPSDYFDMDNDVVYSVLTYDVMNYTAELVDKLRQEVTFTVTGITSGDLADLRELRQARSKHDE